MHKWIAILFAGSLAITSYGAVAQPSTDQPDPHAAKPTKPVGNTNTPPDYLEHQPQNEVSGDGRNKGGDASKKLEKGKSHQEEPGDGGVEIKQPKK